MSSNETDDEDTDDETLSAYSKEASIESDNEDDNDGGDESFSDESSTESDFEFKFMAVAPEEVDELLDDAVANLDLAGMDGTEHLFSRTASRNNVFEEEGGMFEDVPAVDSPTKRKTRERTSKFDLWKGNMFEHNGETEFSAESIEDTKKIFGQQEFKGGAAFKWLYGTAWSNKNKEGIRWKSFRCAFHNTNGCLFVMKQIEDTRTNMHSLMRGEIAHSGHDDEAPERRQQERPGLPRTLLATLFDDPDSLSMSPRCIRQ